MKRRWLSILNTGLFVLFFFSIAHADLSITVKKDDPPFPSYGSGKILVRLYTDYFCPPCRAMEPKLEPILEDMVKRNIINLTIIDTPIYKHSSMYARYFLYALKKKNDYDYANLARLILFEAAGNNIVEKEKLEGLLKTKRIEYVPFDTNPVLTRLNIYLQEDKVNTTPTCVIIDGAKVEKFIGGQNIINALEGIKAKASEPKEKQ
jgi:thiol:disulfide interchange protein DsbA